MHHEVRRSRRPTLLPLRQLPGPTRWTSRSGAAFLRLVAMVVQSGVDHEVE
jgi:hypothetical protein